MNRLGMRVEANGIGWAGAWRRIGLDERDDGFSMSPRTAAP